MNQTYVALAGLVATPPEARTTPSGTRLASFRMVSTERRFDRQSQSWVDGASTWVTVTCWRTLAVNVERSLAKRDRILVQGRMHTHEWLQDGVRRTEVRVTADAVGPDLTFGTTVFERNVRPEADEAQQLADQLASTVEQSYPATGPEGLSLPASAFDIDPDDEEPDDGEEEAEEAYPRELAGVR